jgi:hypothetical protein
MMKSFYAKRSLYAVVVCINNSFFFNVRESVHMCTISVTAL